MDYYLLFAVCPATACRRGRVGLAFGLVALLLALVASPATGLAAAPTVQFNATSESVNAGAGTFSVAFTISSAQGGSPSVFASGFTTPEGLAIDAAGNLYVANNVEAGTVSKVTPNGVVSTFASGFTYPNGLAFDAAGNLYVCSDNGGTLLKLPASPVTVPFTLGGTAVSGLNYTGLTASPLVFPFGQSTATISGSLLSDPEATPVTLVFSLGPPNGAILGAAATNTLTIQPAPSVISSAALLAANASTLIITGANFDPVAAHNQVTLSNGAAGTVTAAASTSLTVTLSTPPTSTGPLTAVVTSDGISTGAAVAVAIVEPVVQFSAASESIDASPGAFSVTATMNPAVNSSTFASGFNGPNGVAFDAGGNLYVANEYANTVCKVTPSGAVSTFASGFDNPTALAFDADGNLYVANYYANTVSKVNPAGTVSVFASGFDYPDGLAFDPAGNLYVSNFYGETVSKVTPTGGVSGFATGIYSPYGLAFDAGGNLYIASQYGDEVFKVTPAGAVSIFVTGVDDPTGLAFDGAGNLYVTGYATMSRVTPSGVVNTFASGFGYSLQGLAFDAAGNLYVADEYNEVVNKLPASTVTVPFALGGSAVAGTDYSSVSVSPLVFELGQGTATITGTLLSRPTTAKTLTFTLGSPTGAVLGNPTVNTLSFVVEPPSVTASAASVAANAPDLTIAGTGFDVVAANNSVSLNDGAAGTVTNATATSLTVALTTLPATAGSLTAIVTTNGLTSGTAAQVATVTPVVTSSTAGVGITAATLTLEGFGFDPTAANDTVTLSDGAVGQVTAASQNSLTVSLSTLPTSTSTLTASVTTDGLSSGAAVPVATVQPSVQFSVASESVDASAGTFSVTVTMTPALSVSSFAAGFNEPQGLAFDAAGNLYVANYNAGLVSKVTPGGTVSTFTSGIELPGALAFDRAGNLYVASALGGSVSKVTPAGAVSGFASGFIEPTALAFDAAGNLYVASSYSGTVSKVTPAGAISTFVTGFPQPQALAFDAAGNLYVASGGSSGTAPLGELSKVTPQGAITTVATGFGEPSGLAFGAGGNIYLTALNATLSAVTPGGVVSTIDSNLSSPRALALDAAGNFYVAEGSSVVKISITTATVPFSLGGTAVAGVDYSMVTGSPLTVSLGSATIAGTLLSRPMVAKTLTLTLDPPISGAVLGNPAANTLTFVVAPPSVEASFASLAGNAQTITIAGAGFDVIAANNAVTFSDGVQGTVTSATATSLLVSLSTPPTAVGPLVATVTTDGLSSGPPVQVADVIPGISPSISNVAANAATLTINGVGFDPKAANNSVSLNNGAVGTVTAATATSLTVTLSKQPTSAGTLTAVVITDGFSSGTAVPIATVQPVVEFSAASESIDASAGSFSVVVTVSPPPTYHSVGAGFSSPTALAFDAAGNLYVANANSVSKVTPSGVVSTFASGFSNPNGLAFDAAGNLYVANSGGTPVIAYPNGNTVSKVTPSGEVSTFASGFDDPIGLAFDSAGNLYVANGEGEKVSKVTPGGAVSTFASLLFNPTGLALDAAGNLYVGSSVGPVSKVTPGGVVSTFSSGFGPCSAVALDAAGNIYLADPDAGLVSEVTPSGTVSIVATELGFPRGLAVDAAGNLYLATSEFPAGFPGEGLVLNLATGTLLVPFTLGGTAVSGADYNVATPSPLIFPPNPPYFDFGENTATIAGTLVAHPGAAKTLTLTLGAPSGAALGSPAVNTLTIVGPSLTPSTAPLAANARSVTMAGSQLNPSATISFNDGATGTVASASANAITVTLLSLPTAAGPLLATLTINGESAPPVQVATVAPVVTSRKAGLAGNAPTIVIDGFGFDPIAANNLVQFSDGTTGVVTAASPNSLVVALTTGPTSNGDLVAVVTTDGVASGGAVQVGTLEPVYTLGASALTESPAAGSDSVVLTVIPETATWVVTASDSWLQVAPASASGTGSVNVIFSFAANGGGPRTGTLTIGDQSLSITQAGGSYVAAGSLTPLVSTGLRAPCGVAVDGSGNGYIADSGNNAIEEYSPSTQTLSTLVSTGLSHPSGVALDAAGNLYIADTFNSEIKKWTASTQTVSTLVSAGLSSPSGVALDSYGDLYIADYGTNTIEEWTAATGQLSTLVSTGLSNPRGVAVDASGNVYIADTGHGVIEEWMPASQTVSILVATGLAGPSSVAVDGSGNLYISDIDDNAVFEWVAATNTLVPLVASGLGNPSGVAVDSLGDLYIGDTGNNAIKELPRVFVDPTPLSESGAAGSDALPPPLPLAANLRPPFAPTSDQTWLTMGSINAGVVNFSFSANVPAPRTAHIALFGQQIAVTQNSSAPYGLTYSANPVTYPEGTAIASNNPTSAGGPAFSYSVSPALPPGLTLGASTGVISGTPTAITPTVVYTITAINNDGSATALLTLGVTDATPTAISQTVDATTHTPAAITLSATEINVEAATYTVLTQPLHGVLSGSAPNLKYTSAPTFAGFDSFTFQASNSAGASQPATVTVEVSPPISAEGYYSGHFVGLISGPDFSTSGTIAINASGTGAFTGSITYGGMSYVLKGVYNSAGQYSINIPRKGLPALTGSLSFGLPLGVDTITGALGGSAIVANDAAYSTAEPASQAGRYTVKIPPDPTQTDGTISPQGYGVGTLDVSSTGAVTFVGVLADGAKFSHGSSLTRDGVWYLYAPLYVSNGQPGGMLHGTIQFQPTPQVSDLDGAVTWIRPALAPPPFPASALYPSGFNLNTHLYGASYHPKGSLVLTPGSMNNTFNASGGSLAGGSLREPALAGKGTASFQVTGGFSLSLTVTTASGFINGGFKETPTSLVSPVNAIIYQDGLAPTIVGSFTDEPSNGTNEGGVVSMTSP